MSRRAALLAPALLSCAAAGCGQSFDFRQPTGAVDLGVPHDLAFLPGPQDPPPQFGPTVSQATTPPPISGGTLVVTADGKTAVAADSDRDAVYLIDANARTLTATVPLAQGDEPGRVAVDGAARAHVVLRRGGAIADIDLASGTLLDRREVCPAPRGIAWDPTGDLLRVACATGELVTLPAAGGPPTQVVQLERDLRDVVIDGATIYVSKFRSAELLTLDGTGRILSRQRPPLVANVDLRGGVEFDPEVAWRTIGIGPGQIVMLHQRATPAVVNPVPGGYGQMPDDKCPSGIVHSALQVLGPNAQTSPGPMLISVVLPVDVAYDAASGTAWVVAAGNAHNAGLSQMAEIPLAGGLPCYTAFGPQPDGEAVAIALDASRTPIVQTREPAMVQWLDSKRTVVSLSTVSVEDTGHAIFHANSGAGLACASCHAEGGEDGRVWSFDQIGARRTQSLRVGVIGTEPFHWDGDERDLPTLVDDVFVGRMSGPPLGDDQLGALHDYLGGIAPWPTPVSTNPAAVARGAALFAADGGCTGCHAGPKLTLNQTVDVGTGAKLQIPSLLGVGYRAPYLHDGRAATLADRFDPTLGGGDLHGKTTQLSPAQIVDLVAYLATL